MLLFLDFDGVLHPRAPRKNLFCNLPRLEAVLREFRFVDVVIASTWREDMSLEQLRKLISPDLRSRIIGVTPVVEIEYPAGPHGTREKEIRLYLEQSGCQDRTWLALDDQAERQLRERLSAMEYLHRKST
jgi:HAD domain in Swiss Army Knife RNA repair proteins